MKRKTKNFSLVIVFFLIALLISMINPFSGHVLSDEMKLAFSFLGTLFAILSGFFIASLWNRINRYRVLITDETAALQTIYKFTELADSKTAQQMAEKIDEYIIEATGFSSDKYQEELGEEFLGLYQPLKSLSQQEDASVPYSRILRTLDHFASSRMEILSREKDKLGFYHWTVLFVLSILLIVVWLYIQFAGWFGIIVGTSFIFAILVVLTIIYDLNNLAWGSEQADIEIYERVYDIMGLSRYYPKEWLERINVPEHVKEYRVGILVDAETNKREIKMINRND